MDVSRYRVRPDTKVDLDAWDPNTDELFDGGKKKGKEVFQDLNTRLEELQELLYAEGKHKIPIVV